MDINLSIIVPIYNVESYLEECLESILNQTYDDYEVILVNDGSTDESQKIIDTYVEKFPIKCKGYIKENGGLSDARNYGMQHAKGKYIGFVDSDDFIDKDMFRLLMEKALEMGADAVMCDVVDYYMSDNSYKTAKTSIDSSLFDCSIMEKPELLNVISASVCNKLFKRSLFEMIQFPKGKIYEDFSCIYNVLLRANKIEYVNRGLYYYRHGRCESISEQDISPKTFDIFDACSSVIDFYKENGAFERCYHEITYSCITRLYFRILDARNTYNIKMRWKYVNEVFKFLNTFFPEWRKNQYFMNSIPDIKFSCLKKSFCWVRTRKYLLQMVLLLYPLYNKIKV